MIFPRFQEEIWIADFTAHLAKTWRFKDFTIARLTMLLDQWKEHTTHIEHRSALHIEIKVVDQNCQGVCFWTTNQKITLTVEDTPTHFLHPRFLILEIKLGAMLLDWEILHLKQWVKRCRNNWMKAIVQFILKSHQNLL